MQDFNRLDLWIQKLRVNFITRHVPEGSSVLDLGCGYYPQALIALKEKIREGVGIDQDISDQTLSTKLQLIKGNIQSHLPLPDNQFDCVLMLAVLEHLDHPQKTLRECYRVLKPGGRLIITIPSNFSRPLLVSLATLGWISKEEIFDHKHYFNKKEAETLLNNARFKKVSSKYYNLFMNLLFVFEK